MRQLVGEYCGLRDGAVCAAGMKDKKAVTTQRCSVPQVKASAEEHVRKNYAALAAATPAAPVILRWPADPQGSYAAVLCAAARSGPVHLGQLQGNAFSVRVSNLRWATADERQRWKGVNATHSTVLNTGGDVTTKSTAAPREGSPLRLRAFVEARFRQCVERGFVNYFGQQRFGETVEGADDHTGVHLFAGRWVAAVRSLYRSCPEVYDAFPEKMESRFVPGNSRDAQVMTHALRQTYRMYFSEHLLTREEVQTGSAVWTRVCEKAITEGVPYFLRSLWVHAGQSAFFNLAASYVVDGMGEGRDGAAQQSSLPPLPYAVVATAYLPLGGYQVHRTSAPTNNGIRDSDRDDDESAVWQRWREAAVTHAVHTLRWTTAQAFEQRKVAGVPVPGSWRALVVQPQQATLHWEEASVQDAPAIAAEGGEWSEDAAQLSARLSFALPSSSYATVFLREVLGCDKWW